MALGRTSTRGRMRNVAMQRASQQQAMQQQRAAALATNRLDRPLGAAPQKPAAMPSQAAGQMAAFNAAQNKNTQGANMNAVMQRSMQQFNQAPAATRVPAQQAQQSPNLAAYNASQQGAMNQFNQMAAFTKQQADAQKQFTAMANAPKMPAMRKGGAVKKKPGYAKGGMAMCGASMPPAQKGKK